MNAYFTLPVSLPDLDQLSEMIRESASIVSLWDEFAEGDWRAFADEVVVKGSTIYAHLDTNVLSYLVDVFDGRNPNEMRRLAASLMSLAVCFDMKVNPTVAIHEYAMTGRDEPDERLAAFYAIDNTHPQVLADYALGRIGSLGFSSRDKMAPTQHRGNLATPIRGDAFYTALVYKVAALHFAPRFKGMRVGARVKRFRELIDWMFYELGFSAAVVQAAAQLWGDQSRKSAIKLSANADSAKFFRKLRNSIWDIVALESWAEAERERQSGDPMHLLFTADQALAQLGPPLFARYDETPIENVIRTFGLHWSSEHVVPIAERYLDYQQRADDPSRRNRQDLAAVTAELQSEIESYLA